MGSHEPQHDVVDIETVTQIFQHYMVFTSREELWETLVTLLGRQAKATVSLWRRCSNTYLQIEPSPLDIVVPRSNLVEIVFKTRTSDYTFHDSAATSAGVANEPSVKSEFALPIFEREALIAVLKLERDTPFEELERNALLCLTGVINNLLEALNETSQHRHTASGHYEITRHDESL